VPSRFKIFCVRYTSVKTGGASRDRTDDPLLAKQVLSQLSYGPKCLVVGLGGLEPPASPLSGVRSNHLSYRPIKLQAETAIHASGVRMCRCLVWTSCGSRSCHSRKEVIQPHLPIRLPCYDFTPVMNHSVVVVPLAVRLTASGATHSHGVTGGVYKARERIHRSIADLRLLAIPTSWSRVADSNPDWDRLSGIGSTSRYCNPLYRPL
jgi:hypothetical protein